MAILQKVFKDEIERITRKEIRAHTEALKRANATARAQNRPSSGAWKNWGES